MCGLSEQIDNKRIRPKPMYCSPPLSVIIRTWFINQNRVFVLLLKFLVRISSMVIIPNIECTHSFICVWTPPHKMCFPTIPYICGCDCVCFTKSAPPPPHQVCEALPYNYSRQRRPYSICDTKRQFQGLGANR